MSTDLDPRLRALLNDLADVPPPPVSTASVLAGARRRRRRRTAGLLTGVALVAAAAVVVPGLALRPGAPAATGGPAPVAPDRYRPPTVPDAKPAGALVRPGAGARVVDVYVGVGNVTWTPGAFCMILDRRTGTYAKVGVDVLSVSPDGGRVAVWDDSDAGGLSATSSGGESYTPGRAPARRRVGIAERGALLAGGLAAVRWLPLTHAYRPKWSADGSRLLVSERTREDDGVRVVVADSRSGDLVSDVTVDVDSYFPEASWAPDGSGFTLPLRNTAPVPDPRQWTSGEAGWRAGGPIQFFDPDGHPTKRWDIRGGVFTGPEAVSPDGTRVIVTTTSPGRDPRTGFSSEAPITNFQYVVDVRTGEVVHTIRTYVPMAWYDDTHLMRVSNPAPVYPHLTLDVTDLRGLVVDRYELSVPVIRNGDMNAESVQLGPAEGLGTGAQRLRF
jgi:hypothetical protein